MIPPEQIEGKAELFLEFEDRLTIFDTLVLCRFYPGFLPVEDPWKRSSKRLRDWKQVEAALREKAKAVATLIRRFNLREGMQPEDERLTKALHQPLTNTVK